MKLGCLEVGTNSERVARKVVSSEDTIITFRDMEKVFNSLINREIDCAVVPVENSITGDIHYKSEVQKLNLVRIREESMEIRHCLATKNRSKNIGFILSHPQALRQCRKYLEKFPTIYVGEVGNTAEAARIIANTDFTNGGAIADYQTCQNYGLNIVEQNIVRNNKSLFWIVKNS